MIDEIEIRSSHLLAGYFCRLLIFDNIENGSLKEHLNDPLKTPLNWRTRLQIANEVVAALVVYASEHSHYIYNKVNFGMDPSQNHKGSQKPSRFDNWCLFCRYRNLGNLPIIIIPTICKDKGSLFGDPDVCYKYGMAYASLSMALTLSGITCMNEDGMNAMGSLTRLRILRLYGGYSSNDSFEINCSASNGFPQLQVFEMKKLKVHNWKLANGAMPYLQHLLIDFRRQLDDLPNEMWSLIV
ncbi:hypothetical protein AHAS_Ahas17G0125200 [Arachis hypogaea]